MDVKLFNWSGVLQRSGRPAGSRCRSQTGPVVALRNGCPPVESTGMSGVQGGYGVSKKRQQTGTQ
eukprot:534894-Pelagomonas_calceolata.AAC.5